MGSISCEASLAVEEASPSCVHGSGSLEPLYEYHVHAVALLGILILISFPTLQLHENPTHATPVKGHKGHTRVFWFSTGRSWFAINPTTRTRLHYYRQAPHRQARTTAYDRTDSWPRLRSAVVLRTPAEFNFKLGEP